MELCLSHFSDLLLTQKISYGYNTVQCAGYNCLLYIKKSL